LEHRIKKLEKSFNHDREWHKNKKSQIEVNPDKYKILPFFGRLIVYCCYNRARNSGWDGCNMKEWNNYLNDMEGKIKDGILAAAGSGQKLAYDFKLLTKDEQVKVVELCLHNKSNELSKEEELELEGLLQKCEERKA